MTRRCQNLNIPFTVRGDLVTREAKKVLFATKGTDGHLTSEFLPQAKQQEAAKSTHHLHLVGEQNVGEREVPVQNIMRMQVE